jgi:hypothetical protein
MARNILLCSLTWVCPCTLTLICTSLAHVTSVSPTDLFRLLSAPSEFFSALSPSSPSRDHHAELLLVPDAPGAGASPQAQEWPLTKPRGPRLEPVTWGGWSSYPHTVSLLVEPRVILRAGSPDSYLNGVMRPHSTLGVQR